MFPDQSAEHVLSDAARAAQMYRAFIELLSTPGQVRTKIHCDPAAVALKIDGLVVVSLDHLRPMMRRYLGPGTIASTAALPCAAARILMPIVLARNLHFPVPLRCGLAGYPPPWVVNLYDGTGAFSVQWSNAIVLDPTSNAPEMKVFRLVPNAPGRLAVERPLFPHIAYPTLLQARPARGETSSNIALAVSHLRP